MVKRRLLSLCLAFTLLSAPVFTSMTQQTGGGFPVRAESLERAEEDEFALSEDVAGKLRSAYEPNTVLTIPQAKFKNGTKELTTKAFLYQPDGTVVSKREVTLSVPGKYSLVYKAENEGKLLQESFSFSVSMPLYSFEGALSSASYGGPEGYPDAPEGLQVQLYTGEKFKLNKSIDLKEISGDAENILSFYAAPATFGDIEARTVKLTLTDVFDPENYLTATMYSFPADWGEPSVYVKAAGVRQVLTGLEWGSAKADIVDYNDRGTVRSALMHRGDNFGTVVFMPMGGKEENTGNNVVGRNVIAFSYDMQVNALYTEITSKTEKQLVADFDDRRVFTNLWNGFTTGEVYLTVEAADYLKSPLNLVFTEFAGVDNLRNTSFTDETAPLITVDYDGYENNIPKGLVGSPYKVFDATASDAYDSNVSVESKVYYGYRTENKSRVECKNGVFIPDTVGVYTIVYTAKDSSGMRSEVAVDVMVTSDARLTGTLGEYQKTASVGKAYTVPLIELDGVKGRSEVSVTAQSKTDASVSYDLQPGGTFTPYQKGEYIITYTYSDYVETKQVTANVTFTYDQKPFLLGSVVLPRYFIKNSNYTLPKINAYSYNGDSLAVSAATVFVKNDSGNYTKAEGGKFKVTASSGITVAYSPTGNVSDIANGYAFTVPVADVGYGGELAMKRYFKTSGLDATPERNSISFAWTAEENKAEFINRLSARDLSVIFKIAASQNKFDALNFYLTDSVDEANVVKIGFRKGNGTAQMQVNDGAPADVTASFGSESQVSLSYVNDSRLLTLGGTSVIVNSTLNGGAFKGFTSDYVYLKIEAEGGRSGAEFEIASISGQFLSRDSYDSIRPVIFSKDVGGEYALGSTVTLSPAYAFDVLDPDVTFTMKVVGPDGKTIVSKEGVTLDETADPSRVYTLVLTAYGQYTVTYTATDTSNTSKPRPVVYTLTVKDKTSPTITLGDKRETAKVGDTITVAKATATDDISSDMQVYVYVQRPDFSLVAVKDNQFKAETEGTYIVYYSVYDAAGSMGTASYKVAVSG